MLGAVDEFGLGLHVAYPQGGVPGEGTEADDGFYTGDQFELADGVGEAGVTFSGSRLVLRRGATDGGRDPESLETQTIVGPPRDRAARETGTIERPEEEVAGAIAGEVPAGTVGSVGG